MRAHLSCCLVSRSVPSSRFGAHGLRSRGFTLLHDTLRWTLSFPLFVWCHVPLENATARFDPNFPIFRRVRFLGGSVSWDTQPNCIDSFSKATDHFPPLFFDFLTGLPISLSVSEKTLVAEFASRCRLVILTYRWMPIITRRIRTLSFEDVFARFLSLRPKPFEGFLPSVCVCAHGAGEDDCAFCPRLHPWLKLQESPLEHCPLLSTESIIPLSFLR